MTDSQARIDARYGYSLHDLLAVEAPAAPGDFAEFWTARYRAARAVDPVARMRASGDTGPAGTRLWDIEFTSTDGLRLGGWLSLPADGQVERGLVVGHGYGGRAAPEAEVPVERAAVLFLTARGLPVRGEQPGLPTRGGTHVLHGIDHRDRYVHGGCVADTWCAVSALVQLVPEAAARIDYLGGSFGGGIGALALPWDDRIHAACLVVPSFGNHPLRVTLPCTGSGESVRLYALDHPEVLEVLRYFDAAAAAGFITIPTHVGLALADPAVPPPGQFAVHNGLAGVRERFLLTAGHLEYPGREAEGRALLADQRRFLSRSWGAAS
ncbi:acetylxylan esterase [Microlunatus parietis]|uniref:Cephalosporin-C deacetylase n=1 Tax=Microlunatus parietis TaxID=682979 RepID=A0A7Y9IC31_9ACTN|nr:acetylxylan esterase [Microlunatus parietis]NYE74178.1 cephalosporin-C deacetylase [Microlunatus parietis]